MSYKIYWRFDLRTDWVMERGLENGRGEGINECGKEWRNEGGKGNEGGKKGSRKDSRVRSEWRERRERREKRKKNGKEGWLKMPLVLAIK